MLGYGHICKYNTFFLPKKREYVKNENKFKICLIIQMLIFTLDFPLFKPFVGILLL